MRNKSIIFLFALIFMIVFSLGAVSADDLQGTDSGTVSGDVDVATVNPWNTSGELTYDIPAEAKEIKSADLYVNVYSGSAQNTYGANANVSIDAGAGEKQIASEQLWIEDGSADGTIYTVNDHVNKCYSDYQMYYDLTDTLNGLNGSSISIKVDSFKMENKSFDGRIKLIALILAYDDGDNDTINYWVDSTQKWTKTNVTTAFATQGAFDITEAELYNVALSSADGSFKLNDEYLGDAVEHSSGNYYQYNYWNVTDKVKEGYGTELLSINAGTSTYGSLKNVLTILKIQSGIITADVSLATEYTSVNTCYAGTNNTITIKAKSDKAADYTIELLADGVVVNSTEIALDGENEASLELTDPTIRAIDETTVNGADNTKVNYAVNVKYNDGIIASASKDVPVLYNGNLGYDMEYDVAGLVLFESEEFFAGDIVIDVQDVSTYLGATAMNRTDVWTVNLTEDSKIKDAYIFIPYNWFNPTKGNETDDMFDVTFNGGEITPIDFYRDQSNLGNYGGYGYGVLIYRVENLINIAGENTLVLNKKYETPAVYPSVLVYWYENPNESIKEISIVAGADLLSNGNNKAGRIAKSDSVIEIVNTDIENATLYVLAASAQAGESNIIVNDKVFTDVWTGTSSTTDLFVADITDILAESNNISFVATGSTILALPQIIVADSGVVMTIDSVKTEYTSVPTAYAGTNNTLTVTVSTNKAGEYEIYLVDGFTLADELKVNLTNGTNTILLTDPKIRDIDETTVNGAENKNVTYTVGLSYGDCFIYEQITVPVLYNGNLGKDLEYNATYIEDFNVIQVTGGFEALVQEDSTYMAAGATNRTDVWNIELDDSSVLTNAFVYIAYNWDKTGVNGPVFNVTFNGNEITSKASYRDQGNLGKYGQYGYGLFVYDVSDLAQNGENTLVINKESGLTAVYPSNLIYFYNTTGKSLLTTVYLADGADLMSNANNVAGRIAKTDSEFAVALKNMGEANLFVFAASAQPGEGNIIFNGNEVSDVWNGSSNSLSQFKLDVTDSISDANSVSFVATGSTILALNQIISVTADVLASEFKDMVVSGNKSISATLVDANGNPIAGETITYSVNGVENTTTTNDNGEFVIQATSNSIVEINYAGSDVALPVNTTITLKDLAPVKVATSIVGNNFTQYAIEYKAGERGGNFTVQLVDANGVPLANKTVLIGYNGKTLERITNETGHASVQINLQDANRLTFAVAFLGDEEYDASMSVYLITIDPKPVTITAAAKSYKASAKTKKYTVTLNTVKSVADGKTYFAAGKKVTMKLNGKTYTAKTNAKGKATFALKITKKGKFKATIKYAGDKTYASASKSVKITIK